jgi:drug/metabolite transporter (DMT)-like permease
MPDKAGFWILLALTAASLEPIFIKLGFRSGATPLQMIVYRNLFALGAILLINRKWVWIGWRNVGLVASVSTLLLLTNAMMIFALQAASAAIVVTAVTTTPAFVAIINQHKGRDQLGLRFWAGFLACFFGVLLTVGAFSETIDHIGWAAVLPLLVAIASSTIYRTRMESVTKRLDPRQISCYIFVINAILSSVFLLPWIDPLPVKVYPSVAWIGAAAAFANLAFLAAIKTLGATRMSIFDMLQRPIVIVISSFALDEPLTITQGVGIILVLVGVRLAKVIRRAN